MRDRREQMAQAFVELGQQRAALVEHLLQPGEQIGDHGLAKGEYLKPPEKLPSPYDEGVILVTDRRLIWASEVDGGLVESYPYAYIKEWNYNRRAKRFPIARHFASLRIETRTGLVVLFKGGQGVLATADAALREATTRDWSAAEKTVAYFHREETFHGRFGLIPGVLRCRECDTNIWPPLPAYCHGCGRTIDWPQSKSEAEAYNRALQELD